MKRTLAVTVSIALLASSSGCAMMGLGKVGSMVKALAKDPATIHMRLPTPYGVIEIDRTNPNAGTAPHLVKDGVIQVGK